MESVDVRPEEVTNEMFSLIMRLTPLQRGGVLKDLIKIISEVMKDTADMHAQAFEDIPKI